MDAAVESNKLYVGNLPFKTTEDDLRSQFERFDVEHVTILKDKETNRSRGFGFITLNNADNVQLAIEACNGMELEGRTLKVSRASARGRGGGSSYQNTSDRSDYRSYSGYSAASGGGGYGLSGQYHPGVGYSTGRGYTSGGGGYSSGVGYSSGSGGYTSAGFGGYGSTSSGYGTSDGYNSTGGQYGFSSDGGWNNTGSSYYGSGYSQGYGRGGRGGRRGGGSGWGGDY